jgi:hypothetical protein
VDTKKKERVGNFKNNGRAWRKEAEAVNVHDFLQEGLGRAVPYGIYDLSANHGFVRVGTSADTPEFAVDALCRWWEQEGRRQYPSAGKLLILAESPRDPGTYFFTAPKVLAGTSTRHDWCLSERRRSPR